MKRNEVSEMTGFEWLLVLVPVLVGGVYLLGRRRAAATPYISIKQNTGFDTHDEAGDATQPGHAEVEAQRPHHHQGCCSVRRS